ncbi:MAG: hypothetical protein IT454_16735 [Planctomycetes bacterium]|nr:hypothetical protein [Planctomycetota bacterium]
MHSSFSRALCALLCACAVNGRVLAQAAPIAEQQVTFVYDSGALANTAASEQVLASHTVRVAHASWIRLRFQMVDLGSASGADQGAFLRITSHADGAVQELHAQHVREWRLTSAYFNGDAVQLDLVAPPGAGPSRVILRNVWIGPQLSPQFNLCGPTDDRLPSSDVRAARLLPYGCSGWMFDDAAHGFITAGHCVLSTAVPNSLLDVAQFNVPKSNAAGVLQHPSPDHQYAIDDTSLQFENGGVGNDWGYFGCFPNPNTGLTPFQAQGACYALAAPPTFNPNEVLRVTGFGTDMTPDPTLNQVQQSHAGPFASFNGTVLRYEVDTTGGNSGSAVSWNSPAGEFAVGVHTHAGCSAAAPFLGNYGTSSQQANWVAARANPRGVCLPTSAVSTYCTAKVNSLGCTPSLGALGAPSASGGAGSFTIRASNLINHKVGLLFYGFMPAAKPFHAGFKCIDAPVKRTPPSSTGGALAGSDCSGVLDYDMGARIASGVDPHLVLGAVVYAQVWSRDPADPTSTNLTGGLRFTIGP